MQAGTDWRARAVTLLPLLLICLIARGLIPAGWMPSFTQQGVSLVLCSGVTAESVVQPSAHGDHSGHHGTGRDHPDKSKHDMGGQQCSFAAAAVDLPSPVQPADPTDLPAAGQHFAKPQEVAVGQGLAAPPPPSTGPPVTA